MTVDPDKSGPFDKLMVLSKVEGHTRNEALSTMVMGSWCPDFRGTLKPPVKGHAEKKTSPCSLL
jgi:hypothetical protein